MSFKTDKEKTLKRMFSNDKSNKGSVDKQIKPLIDKINFLDNYYTTSSCSGRIIIIRIPESGLKKEAEFLYRTHEKGNSKEIISVVNNLLNTGDSTIWFRQEPAILHVASETLKDASKFLRTARLIGFKRSGIFEVDKRFLMELVSTERIDAILVKDGKVMVSDDYIKLLVDEGNKRLERTWEKTKKLKQELDKLV